MSQPRPAATVTLLLRACGDTSDLINAAEDDVPSYVLAASVCR